MYDKISNHICYEYYKPDQSYLKGAPHKNHIQQQHILLSMMRLILARGFKTLALIFHVLGQFEECTIK
jgi:hypothetical protein